VSGTWAGRGQDVGRTVYPAVRRHHLCQHSPFGVAQLHMLAGEVSRHQAYRLDVRFCRLPAALPVRARYAPRVRGRQQIGAHPRSFCLPRWFALRAGSFHTFTNHGKAMPLTSSAEQAGEEEEAGHGDLQATPGIAGCVPVCCTDGTTPRSSPGYRSARRSLAECQRWVSRRVTGNHCQCRRRKAVKWQVKAPQHLLRWRQRAGCRHRRALKLVRHDDMTYHGSLLTRPRPQAGAAQPTHAPATHAPARPTLTPAGPHRPHPAPLSGAASHCRRCARARSGVCALENAAEPARGRGHAAPGARRVACWLLVCRSTTWCAALLCSNAAAARAGTRFDPCRGEYTEEAQPRNPVKYHAA